MVNLKPFRFLLTEFICRKKSEIVDAAGILIGIGARAGDVQIRLAGGNGILAIFPPQSGPLLGISSLEANVDRRKPLLSIKKSVKISVTGSTELGVMSRYRCRYVLRNS